MKTDRELLERVLDDVRDLRAAVHALHDTLNELHIKVDHMSQTTSNIDTAVAALQAQVAQQTTVEASAATLLSQLFTTLTNALAADSINPQDAPNVMAAVQALQTSGTSLAAAVTANTPAASSTGTTATASTTGTDALSTGGTASVAGGATS